MWAKIRKWLGITAESSYVQNYLDFSNMRSSIYMSSVFIVLELWMIERLFQDLITGARQRSAGWIAGHIISYSLLLGIAVIMLIYSLRSLKREQNLHKRTMLLCWLFAIISIAFGTYIAYNDYLKGEQIFVFVSMLIFSLCLLVWNPLTALILSSLSFLGMYYIMVYIDGASYATRVNFFVMWICVIMSAFANYHQRLREAKKDERLEETNAHLTHISLYDELTGMKNRNGMLAELSDHYGKELIVLMADVDSFKYINDTYGHEIGDEVLRKMALLFQEIFEKKDSVHCYRFGGDEFIIFADDKNREDFLADIRTWQEGLYKIGFLDTGIRVLCSCGYVYGVPQNREDIRDMIRFADQKLYEAKHHGRMQLLGEPSAAVAQRENTRPSGKRMMTESETDPMTGLPNMLYFREHADKLMKDMLEGTPLAFLYYDIGNFKAYNEKYGFQSGDVLLRQFAEKLDSVFLGELVARASDDHFIVLTQNTDYEGAVNELSAFLFGEQHEVQLQLKTGVYIPENIEECDSSLACDRARIACNSVKKHFNEHIRVYDKELEKDLHRKQYIVNNLDTAIEQGYIKVFYQPIVWLSTGKVCGLEALARWDDPVYGLLSPGIFIEVLEEYRQIHKLDLCITRQVCQDLQEARDAGRASIPVSLNFSRLDFELCDMVKLLEDIAAEYNIPSSLLDVEITESALMDHPEFLSSALDKLRKDGFRLWMDDFGSGYSSLNVLKDYEFDVLKIDMKFLSDFADNDRSKPILNNVVRLANEMSMRPLTEGVETDEQISFLNSIGCECAQGYYYGRPMEKSKLIDFFARGELLISEECLAM